MLVTLTAVYATVSIELPFDSSWPAQYGTIYEIVEKGKKAASANSDNKKNKVSIDISRIGSLCMCSLTSLFFLTFVVPILGWSCEYSWY